MHKRYENLESVDLRWMAQGIGVYAGGLTAGTNGQFGHPGDDTGRVAVAAYRQIGAAEAAEVLRSFKRGYDAKMLASGLDAVTDEKFIRTVGLALSIELESEEIDEVGKHLEVAASKGALTDKTNPGDA